MTLTDHKGCAGLFDLKYISWPLPPSSNVISNIIPLIKGLKIK
tara:strand:- start:276 stop:404 length:129 start_codon:yes stop_codon:yes gene_type:complete